MVLLQDMILPQHQSQDPRPHKYLRAVDEETRRPLRDRFCKLVRMADEKIRKNEPMSSSCPGSTDRAGRLGHRHGSPNVT